MSQTGSDAVQTARRILARLLRCHPVTWCVALVVSLAMLLIVVPGGLRQAPDGSELSWWDRQIDVVYLETQQLIQVDLAANPEDYSLWLGVMPGLYEHGWPRPYLVRSLRHPGLGGYHEVRSRPLLRLGRKRTMCNGQEYEFVAWSNYDNWPLESEAWRIHPVGLVTNAVAAISIVGGLGFVVEWWLRSRGGLLRFRIVDLLAAVTLVAVVAGWYEHHARLKRIDLHVAEHFTLVDPEHQRRYNAYRSYFGPKWLARLVGDDAYLPLFHRTRHASLCRYDSWREDVDQVVRLRDVEQIDLNGTFPKSAIERLKDCKHLKRVDISFRYCQPEISPIYSDSHPDDIPVGPQNLDALSLLDLREVTLLGSPFLAVDVQRLLAATELERLRLYDVSMTATELQELRRRFPETSIEAHRMNKEPSHVESWKQWRVGQFNEKFSREGAP